MRGGGACEVAFVLCCEEMGRERGSGAVSIVSVLKDTVGLSSMPVSAVWRWRGICLCVHMHTHAYAYLRLPQLPRDLGRLGGAIVRWVAGTPHDPRRHGGRGHAW